MPIRLHGMIFASWMRMNVQSTASAMRLLMTMMNTMTMIMRIVVLYISWGTSGAYWMRIGCGILNHMKYELSCGLTINVVKG